MTVSRVLNGQASKVAQTTRERILQAVHDLEYVPVAQPAAQHRASQTRVISLVFDQLDELRDYVGTEIHVGLRDGAREHGYDLLTILREAPDWAGERDEVRFLDRRSDGVIFVNPFRRYALMEKLIQHDVPLVSCFGLKSPPGVATIEIDNVHAIGAMVNHLHLLGHRAIGFLQGPEELGGLIRKAAFIKALAAHDLECKPQQFFAGTPGDSWVPNESAIISAVRQAAQSGLTALVCANDSLAIVALDIASSLGISVPAQLAITGFDDLPVAERRGITTVRHPFAALGHLAINALVEVLNGGEAAAASRCIRTSLVIRQSTVVST